MQRANILVFEPHSSRVGARFRLFDEILVYDCLSRSLAFESSISLVTDICSGAAALGEEARENGVDEGSEDDLCTVGDRERHPQDEDELEDVVEGYTLLVSPRWQLQNCTYGTSRRH
jgi:hypothetical protein